MKMRSICGLPLIGFLALIVSALIAGIIRVIVVCSARIVRTGYVLAVIIVIGCLITIDMAEVGSARYVDSPRG